MPVPVIDLFAGPGGLGEGFASLQGHKRQPFFEIALSIEKDAVAHPTLTLRAVFRRLHGTNDVRHYYSYVRGSYVRGEIDEAAFRRIPAVASAFEYATTEARCLELGKFRDGWIGKDVRYKRVSDLVLFRHPLHRVPLAGFSITAMPRSVCTAAPGYRRAALGTAHMVR